MYCKNCGKNIADDSNFCKYCGKILASDFKNSLEPANQSEIKNTSIKPSQGFAMGNIIVEKDKKHNKKVNIILTIILILALLGGAIGVVYGVYENTYGTSITEEDFTYWCEIGEQNITITIKPKVDIKNFKFIISFYGSNIFIQNNNRIEVEEVFANIQLHYSYSKSSILAELDNDIIKKIDINTFSGYKKNMHKQLAEEL